MTEELNVRLCSSSLYFLTVKARTPLKFSSGTTTSITCARVRVGVVNCNGQIAEGWGETPLAVQWSWPSRLSYEERHRAMKQFSIMLAKAWAEFSEAGHPIEIGHAFQKQVLSKLLEKINKKRGTQNEPMPWLAALVCCSAFDIALHDAYGILHNKSIYETYAPPFMNYDLSRYLEPAEGTQVSFVGKYPNDFLIARIPEELPAWHLVGGLDALDPFELTGQEPNDGYPVTLIDWISQDGLRCLKVKLLGNDSEWDYQRFVRVGEIAISNGVEWLSVDFNCNVTNLSYINLFLDRLLKEHPQLYDMVLYIEQPFPYDLNSYPFDVSSISARKPLFLDESAQNWEFVRLGRKLGWTGVALKTCKSQTGALLSLCWAKAHGMSLMVQDLTNPMLAQIPHTLLAAHAGTIMGIETNAMQFWPDASLPEEAIHPGLYKRRQGKINLSTIRGPGFGYRVAEISRRLPRPSAEFINSDCILANS